MPTADVANTACSLLDSCPALIPDPTRRSRLLVPLTICPFVYRSKPLRSSELIAKRGVLASSTPALGEFDVSLLRRDCAIAMDVAADWNGFIFGTLVSIESAPRESY